MLNEKLSGLSAESMFQEINEVLEEFDSLFGFILDYFLGFDVLSGKFKIVKEVMEDMRFYLRVVEGAESLVSEESVKKFFGDLENDSVGQKIYLSLEFFPSVIKILDKGKGYVYDFGV